MTPTPEMDRAVIAEKGATEALHKAQYGTPEYRLAEAGQKAAISERMRLEAAAKTRETPAHLRPMDPAKLGVVLPELAGDPRAGDVLRRNGVSADIARVAMNDGQRSHNLEAAGRDPEAGALRVVNGALGADADRLLKGAREMVRRDPELRDLLNRTRMGDSPWMVRHLGQEAIRRGIIR